MKSGGSTGCRKEFEDHLRLLSEADLGVLSVRLDQAALSIFVAKWDLSELPSIGMLSAQFSSGLEPNTLPSSTAAFKSSLGS